ncbi:DUF5106 domain-containing protein [Sphingobacterium deserti]|uniref:Thioredoxin domain-containing protein n=1 Tax=Sphingobacterium deserti TaxID=1229276 RepID=A0A0B8T0V6_9SPHI|nr:DUF5106 domain-containing protein [Sphingobacterium deserti]KGE14136.1 hypothetical protein DI53_1966 [Sphingobacterium deserti]
MDKVYFLPRLLYFFLLFAMAACSQERASNVASEPQAVAVPEKAAALTADTVIMRYWRGYDFHDEVNITNPDKGEQSLVNFINLFPSSSPDVVSRSIKSMLSDAQQVPAALDFFIKQYEKYLYDPNSPVRNDVYYIPVLEFTLDSMQLDELEKVRTANRLTLLRKNLPGETAADFSYVLGNGDRGQLSKLSSPLTVLFFYEPGCSHCEEAIQQLEQQPYINKAIEDKSLAFLAVYPFGGKDIWKAYQSHIPDKWINGFDEQGKVVKKGLYDLKATPTIFLLDADKKVILKDVDVVQLLGYFGLR